MCDLICDTIRIGWFIISIFHFANLLSALLYNYIAY